MITKLDAKMFHDENWKTIYFGVKGQGHESKKHCQHGSLHSCECRLLLLVVVMFDVCILCHSIN